MNVERYRALLLELHDVVWQFNPVSGAARRRRVSTATLTNKGQITIPVDVRRALTFEPGDRVDFVQIEPRRFEVIAAKRSVRELKRRLGKPRRAIAIDEMNAATAAQAAPAR
jgi:AbrB family looped-hinge helix DNA binding protein